MPRPRRSVWRYRDVVRAIDTCGIFPQTQTLGPVRVVPGTRGPACIRSLSMVEKDGNLRVEHLLFRDYLKKNPLARHTYAALKRRLVRLFPRDRDRYTEEPLAGGVSRSMILPFCGLFPLDVFFVSRIAFRKGEKPNSRYPWRVRRSRAKESPAAWPAGPVHTESDSAICRASTIDNGGE